MYDHTFSTASRHAVSESSGYARTGAPSVVRATPRVDSGRLLAGGNELVIEHAGQEYRLRLTRNDKLILTK